MITIYMPFSQEVDLQQVAMKTDEFARAMGGIGFAVVNLVKIHDFKNGQVAISSGEFGSRFSRPRDPSRDKTDQLDQGTDYAAMARVKATKRIRHYLGLDTDEPSERRGEVNVFGDSLHQINDNTFLVTAYSGFSEQEKDREVAQEGIEVYKDFVAALLYEGDYSTLSRFDKTTGKIYYPQETFPNF